MYSRAYVFHSGRDFNTDMSEPPLTVAAQVDRLIIQATSLENLCQCFSGWYVTCHLRSVVAADRRCLGVHSGDPALFCYCYFCIYTSLVFCTRPAYSRLCYFCFARKLNLSAFEFDFDQ